MSHQRWKPKTGAKIGAGEVSIDTEWREEEGGRRCRGTSAGEAAESTSNRTATDALTRRGGEEVPRIC